jgi:hypothetical protein
MRAFMGASYIDGMEMTVKHFRKNSLGALVKSKRGKTCTLQGRKLREE